MADNLNQSGNNFNPNGAQVQMAVDAAMAEQKKKKRKKKLIILAVIVGVFILLGVIIGSGSDDSDSKADNPTTAATLEANAQSGDVEATEADKAAGEIGKYNCVVKSAELCKDYEGNNAVKIVYTFTNNNDVAESFDLALDDNVYQDGIELETAYLTDDDDVDYGLDVKIKPGKSKDVTKVYKLRDTKTELEVEIGEFLSFDDTKITTKVKIKK